MRTLGKRVRRGVAVTTLTGVVLAATTGIALATGTLDQRNPGPSNEARGMCETRLAQTFTAGLTGALDTVEIEVRRDTSPGDLVVAIEGTGSLANPGIPDDSDVLATQTIAEGDVSTASDIVLTVVFAAPAAVEAGTKYAIVLSAPSCVTPEHGTQGYSWASIDASYAGGDGCLTRGVPESWDCGDNFDLVFATYVTTVPAPPSADVRVTVSGPASGPEGAQVTYLITVSNFGPDTAHNVVLTAPVPSGSKFVGITTTRGQCVKPLKGPISCALGDLANGDSSGSALTVKLTVKAGSNVTDLATASSTANGAGPATADPDTSNNWTSLTTSVTAKSTGRPGH
jgi:uncharacterized repeat protein (TIGR01451 family)